MTIREGRWDCPSCGCQAIRGRHKICTQCGFPRPEGIRFYLPDDEPEVLDAELVAEARSGADWVCEFCGASSRADLLVCRQCSAPRGTSPRQAVREYDLEQVPRSADPVAPVIASSVTRPVARAPGSRPGGFVKWLAGSSALLVLLVAWLVWPRTQTLTVQGVSWQRTIQVERLRTVREQGWSVPPGGRLISQQPALHHTEQVLDHYETRTRDVTERVQVGTEQFVSGQRDLGNGYFEEITSSRPVYESRTRTETYREPVYRSVPIMRTQYTYDIERWMPDGVARAAGRDHEPRWPEVAAGEKVRAGPRTEQYAVRLSDSRGREYEREVPLAQWRELIPGSQRRVRLNAFGKIKAID
ncbi:MAG: hypothetical protein J5I93_23220 [Pirellulaceae bacterium]|nr:hypothetical protein [Pirellulaceae bacterium]